MLTCALPGALMCGDVFSAVQCVMGTDGKALEPLDEEVRIGTAEI